MKQALYRKYRPKNFDEVLGQDNIVNILKNQIKNDKISHAYVFSGTRGTGKTSTAKIFAKAVNCLNPINGNPCNKCANCLAINEEKSMDIVEMDAASNRRIDDIRQIRDQVIYPPSLLKYKVYIIDEAHMITNEGFNALLKIMEEPPKHLIFILATTEIEKIPNTILSRTQRFEFKSISQKDINKQIDIVLDRENIELDNNAKLVIANVAKGAMRDALSILDQVISIGKKHITDDDVYDLLGIFSDKIKVNLANAIFRKDIKYLLEIIDEQFNKGKNPNNFMKEMIAFFHDIIYIKAGVNETKIEGLDDSASINQLINSVDILLEYEEMMKKSDSADLLFKICAIRLVDYMPRKSLEAKIKTLEERIEFLENNRIGNQTQNINISDNIRNKSFNNEVEVNEDGTFLQEDDLEEITDNFENIEEIENIEENHANNKENFSKQKDSDILLDILKEKYEHSRLILEGLKRIEQRTNEIVLFIDEAHINMRFGMKVFFEKAQEDLEKKVGKNYRIICELYSDDLNKLNKETDEKIDKLKDFFKGNLKIEDKK